MKKFLYVLHVDGKGYYANKQPKYAWSWTDDLNLAKQYKSKTAVLKRANHKCSEIAGRECEISILDVKVVKMGDTHLTKTKLIGKLDIDAENAFQSEKNIEDYRKNMGEETYKLVNAPLNVKVDKIKMDDPFWD